MKEVHSLFEFSLFNSVKPALGQMFASKSLAVFPCLFSFYPV